MEGGWIHIDHRSQFPVRLCFAMTIDEAQGQSLRTVGVRSTFAGICSWSVQCGFDVHELDVLLPE